jgi:hypothetical protein
MDAALEAYLAIKYASSLSTEYLNYASRVCQGCLQHSLEDLWRIAGNSQEISRCCIGLGME